mgnify:CR=1 FL=1
MQLKKPIEIDLILDYEAICEKIVAKFAKKQDFYFETGRDSHINYKSYINGLRYKDLKTKFMKEEKTKLRKPKKYKAYKGLVLIGTTFAIDSARLLAENYGDRVVFKRNGEIVEEIIKP